MWLAQQQKRTAAQAAGEVGEVTLGGDAPAVELDSERRGLEVYAPGGYRWRPAPGQTALVLHADGEPCVVGVRAPSGLQPGEISLDSAGGACILLDNQGKVTVGKDVSVQGKLFIGGTELTALVRQIAAQVIAGG